MTLGRILDNVRAGRLQRTLSAAVGASAAPLAFEIYLEHYKGSFSDPWEWSPIVLSPPLALAGLAGVCSERAARTVLPVASALFAINGLAGTYFHARGVAKRPGGYREPTYNLVMGPPLLAPGSLIGVGALGLIASLMPRER